MGRTACIESQCLYNGALSVTFTTVLSFGTLCVLGSVSSEKQNTATTTTVCATTHMDIQPPRGKTGASWEHTNTRSVSKGPYIQGHSGLPTTRPQLRGRKRNTPPHNTSEPEPSNLTLATSTTTPLVRASPHIEITLSNKARM